MFDEDQASSYRPRAHFTKTAIRINLEPEAVTTLSTSFGTQKMIGSFYLVADGANSYGAARHEFESSHYEAAPNEWVKFRPVAAYQLTSESSVTTVIGSQVETTVEAQIGDWLVRQPDGEINVIRNDAFSERYEI